MLLYCTDIDNVTEEQYLTFLNTLNESDDIRPTMSNDGRPLQMSVSTVTGSTTTPVIVAQLALHTINPPPY